MTRAKARWTKNTWAGRDNYACNLCPFATLEHGLMEQHARERHPLPSEEAAAPPTTSETE
jgi:hypothetical protein